MRKKWDEQLSIWHYLPKNRVSRELRGISEILDAHPEILEAVYKDLSQAHRVDTGRDGMTADRTGAAVRRLEAISDFDLRRTGVPFAGFAKLSGFFQVADGAESFGLDAARKYQSPCGRDLDGGA